MDRLTCRLALSENEESAFENVDVRIEYVCFALELKEEGIPVTGGSWGSKEITLENGI